MHTDINKYSLLQLLPINNLSVEERKKLIETYQKDVEAYVIDQLIEYFTEQDDEEMEHLLADPKTTNAELQQFYEMKIPDFQNVIKKLATKFKKQYVLPEYEKHVHDIEAMVQKYLVMQKRFPNEETSKRVEEQRTQLYLWRTILQKAQSEDWHTAQQLLKEINL